MENKKEEKKSIIEEKNKKENSVRASLEYFSKRIQEEQKRKIELTKKSI